MNADYRKQLKEKSAGLKDKLGLTAAKIDVRSANEFAPGHCLVESEWTMKFERSELGAMRPTFRISYLLRLAEPGPVILAYVSHEDEGQVMKRDGIN